MTHPTDLAAAMREAAAQVADTQSGRCDGYTYDGGAGSSCYDQACSEIAATIRALPLPAAQPDPRDEALRLAREALAPFGKSRKMFSGHRPYDEPNLSDSFGLEIFMATTEDGKCDFTLGQFRRAKRALAAIDALKE